MSAPCISLNAKLIGGGGVKYVPSANKLKFSAVGAGVCQLPIRPSETPEGGLCLFTLLLQSLGIYLSDVICVIYTVHRCRLCILIF